MQKRATFLTGQNAYLAFVTIGLVAGFAARYWSLSSRSVRLPAMHVPILMFAVAAAAALLPLKPNAALYASGLLCFALAFVSFWLASPDGLAWAGRLPYRLPYGGRPFGYLFLLLFPAGWILVSASFVR